MKEQAQEYSLLRLLRVVFRDAGLLVRVLPGGWFLHRVSKVCNPAKISIMSVIESLELQAVIIACNLRF